MVRSIEELYLLFLLVNGVVFRGANSLPHACHVPHSHRSILALRSFAFETNPVTVSQRIAFATWFENIFFLRVPLNR